MGEIYSFFGLYPYWNSNPLSPLIMNLSEIAFKEKRKVLKIKESSLKNKLLEMGFIPGAEVELLQRAPLGDPYLVRVSGYKIMLRRQEANEVIVE